MKKILLGAMVLASASALAQETYENTNLLNPDLNGTARYVGMGGAMDALGADISTIGTNPAGIGLMRRSAVNMSIGLNSQADCGENRYADATNMSFDQIGFVWANQWDENRYVNFGFNYHKQKNLDQITNVAGNLDAASQNCLTYMKCMTTDNINSLDISQLDVLYWNALNLDNEQYPGYNAASGFNLSRATKGRINSYDLNISGNVSDKVYLGMTMGIMDVDYTTYSAYTENLINSQDQGIGTITVNDERRVSGSGVDLTFGAIILPIEECPFRVGLSVATPTWYDLRTQNWTYLSNNADLGFTPYNANYRSEDSYDYKVFTPWKFGLSLGHTIDNYIALGAGIDYSDYSRTKSRIITDYDYLCSSDSRSENDVNMNVDTKANLKGVTTLKLGAEVKPTPEVAVRVGYNYVAPTFKKGAYRDPYCWSDGNYISSQADYTNWKATNRLTCGVGYSKGAFSADLAYQFSTTKGEFHPFADAWADIEFDDGTEKIDNYATPVDVKNNRHHLIATLTYKF